MLNRKVRSDLEELRSRLARWAVELPARATRFHDLRADLDQRVSTLLERWILRQNDTELVSLRAQVDRLGELAPPLFTLIRRAEDIEKEVHDLRSGAERSTDRDLASWLVDRCVDWQFTLRRLGTNLGRQIEMEQDQAALERTQDRVRRHAEALRRLDEARQLLARLGDKMETATLRADLPPLRVRLFEEGATAAWLAEMDRIVDPVRAVVDLPPPKPPRTLEQVPPLLSEVRRWARVLHAGEESAFGLQERYKVAEAEWGEWTDEQIQSLLQEVSQLLETLRRTAAERRAAALALLEKLRRQLAAACGPNLGLDRKLAELGDTGAGEPETYAGWMERHDEVDRHLRAAAGGSLVDLQEWIVRWQRELQDGLSALGRGPLSVRAASEAERLRLEVEDLPNPYELTVEALFQSLETCDRIKLALDSLVERARGEREALGAVQRDLLARNQALRLEVARSGIEVTDPGPRIEALTASGSTRALDDLRLEAESLELELGAAEKELVARCAVWIAERLEPLCVQIAVLRRMGRPAGELPASLAEDATPAQAALAVARLRELEAELSRQLDEARRELEARGEGLREQLAELLQRSLRPEVRRDTADLARWLEERPWESFPEPENRVRRLLDGLERCDTLLAKLSQEEREARAKAQALRQRLRSFNERDLDRFCPEELVQRASALIAAIPAEPPSWLDLAGQLEEAERLIGCLEAHGQRVLAARLEQAIPDLKRQAQATKDPVYARRVQTLLDELATHDEHQPVPAVLTSQILMLAPERLLEG